VPKPGEVAVLNRSNGLLTNTFRSTVAPYYSDYFSASTVDAYSGSVVNPYYGIYGAVVFEGGGHADSNDNSVHVLELNESSASFRRVTNPTPLFGAGSDEATRMANSHRSAEVVPLTDFLWAEYSVDGQPVSRHSCGAQDVIGPEHGGARYGSFVRALVSSGAVHGGAGGEVAHRVDFNDLTGTMSWTRACEQPGVTGPISTPGRMVRAGPPNWTAHVPAQGRIYLETYGATASIGPRWLDLTTRRYVDGTGKARVNDGDTPDSGVLFHVEWRNMLVHGAVVGGKLCLRCMDVSVQQPTWVNQPRLLSQDIPLAGTWSAACWCPDNGRIIVANVLNDPAAVYEIEIPTSLDAVWRVERVPLPEGQSMLFSSSATYKKWSYNTYVRAIVFVPWVARSENDPVFGNDQVFVYRPRST
jgi:hypothetical protein